MKNLILVSLSFFFILSCGSEQESEESSEENTETVDSTGADESLVFDENDYINDWIEIRESILAADTSTLESYIETTETDARSLIMMCEENWVRDELMELPYEHLSDVDYNGEMVKEFYAEILEDIDGIEYGSAIYIYLKETKSGLRISGLMAAG